MRSLTSEFSRRLERDTLGSNMSNKILRHGICLYVGTLFATPFLFGTSSPAVGQATQHTIAIVGATMIDGNGGPPIPNGTILVEGARILVVGSRASVEVPADAQVIDGIGKYVGPGFIDTNVHMSSGFGRQARLVEHARYWPVHEQGHTPRAYSST